MLRAMTIWDHFIRLRADLPVWVWPLLLFELWAAKAWALEEAERRGLDQIALIISVDDWGRVRVHFVTEPPLPPNPLECLAAFALPVPLVLDQGESLFGGPPVMFLTAGEESGTPHRRLAPSVRPPCPDTS